MVLTKFKLQSDVTECHHGHQRRCNSESEHLSSTTNPLSIPSSHWNMISISEHIPPIMEPIAIVGMAVNMPSAPNIERLWELLHNGESTLSQVWVRSQVAP